jgi:hypothetical protein
MCDHTIYKATFPDWSKFVTSDQDQADATGTHPRARTYMGVRSYLAKFV